MNNLNRYKSVCHKYNRERLHIADIFYHSQSTMIENYRRGLMSEADLYNGLHLQMSRYDNLSVDEKIEVWEVAAYLDPFEEEFHLQEYYPEESPAYIEKPWMLFNVSDTFWQLYTIIESASHLSEAEKVRVYGTEGLDVITSMFLGNFCNNMEVSLYFHSNYKQAGSIKIENPAQAVKFISMGYIPVPTK